MDFDSQQNGMNKNIIVNQLEHKLKCIIAETKHTKEITENVQ